MAGLKRKPSNRNRTSSGQQRRKATPWITRREAMVRFVVVAAAVCNVLEFAWTSLRAFGIAIRPEPAVSRVIVESVGVSAAGATALGVGDGVTVSEVVTVKISAPAAILVQDGEPPHDTA
jgi:hypothetical protein